MRIISRAEWGARPPTKPPLAKPSPAPRLWLHHTAGPMGGASTVKATQRYHQQVRGWRDIAYQWLIANDGVYEGITGRHLNSDAAGSAAICLVGDFDTHRVPEQMIDSTAWLVAHGLLSGWWSCDITGGHRDIAKTVCPGRHGYAAIPVINARARQIVLGLTSPTPPDHFTEEDEDMPFVLHDNTTNMHYLATPGKCTLRPLSNPLPYMNVPDGNPFGYRKISVPHALRAHQDGGWTLVKAR